ncbi:MAG: hypothetical protein KA586_10665 [Candidatus Promineofilum sp.]|nr:hypothetical protein [Promineifilum sp.]
MPSRKKIVIDDIPFESNEPTVVPISQLFTWVIWQFPRLRKNGFNGAVHPPQAGHGWYPAIVDAKGGHVTIYGQIKEPYPSPEVAAKYLDKAET